MKLSLHLGFSLFMLALFLSATFLLEARQAELRARVEACHLHPYTCNTPTGSLAMLR
ncbi:hypothetical protein EMIT0194P_180056 [Pseudomonas serbica]